MKNADIYQTTQRADAAVDALRRAIQDRVLEPGTRLPAMAIGSGFGMSRTLAREVLLRLEGVGLVEIRPKRGAIVACPSLDEAKDVFEVRRCLEAQSLDRLSAQWSPALQQELESHVREEEASSRIDDLGASIQKAEGFHLKLAHMSGNQTLAQYIDELVSRCSLIISLYGRPHVTECAVSEHRMILEALKRGDKAAALKFMDDHLVALQDCVADDHTPPTKLPLQQVISRYANVGDEPDIKIPNEVD